MNLKSLILHNIRLWGFLGMVMLMSGWFISCSGSEELEWRQEDHYRWAEINPGYFGSTGFEHIGSSQTRIDFTNRISQKEISENRHYLNGSGVAAGDINGDGLVDLYFAGLKVSNRLYENQGDMQFRDITKQAGVEHRGYYSTGAIFADVDGDSDLDLLVSSVNKENALYINDGAGHFSRATDSGLGDADGSMTMTMADVDQDRDLDLYITHYKEKTVKDLFTTEELAFSNILNERYDEQHQTGPFTLTPPFDQHYQIFMTEDNRFAGAAETGEKDELYLNVGGRFQKVSDTKNVFLSGEGAPMGLKRDWGLAAKFQDLNGDGLPDLYVCNDFFTPDRIWINRGNGTFKAIKWTAVRNMSFACMGVDFSDINRDGLLDMFTTEMLSPRHEGRLQQVGSDDPVPPQVGEIKSQPTYNRNSMYLQRADNTYAEISYLSGTQATGWSWDASFMDVNLDGYEDLLVTTGYLYHILDMDAQMSMRRKGRNMDEHFTEFMRQAPPLDLHNRIFINNGDLTFEEKGPELGFEESDVSHGMATADLDNDGALDVVINRMNQEAGIYRNTTGKPRIAVRLKGQSPNTQAIGASIELRGGAVLQQKVISAGGDYLSGSDPMVMFAAEPDSELSLVVTWPDGQQSRIEGVRSNRLYEITEPEAAFIKASARPDKKSAPDKTIFADVSDSLDHSHFEKSFGDFQLQSLLPGRLSQLGPGLAWIDLDRDNDDDLVIGAGKGGVPGAFENVGKGSFRPLELPPLSRSAPGDQAAVIGWGTGAKSATLLVGSANYEQGTPQVPAAFQYRLEDGRMVAADSLQNYSTTGPLAAADYDGDGDLDLFLGGRFVPAHYPRDASSRLFANQEGSFVLDRTNSLKLNEFGLVTGAVFSDYDGDGDPDLLLSREWDSIVLMENENGVFNDVSEQMGLSGFRGWWTGIATGDFNNDGRPDIAATNRGLNSPYRLTGGKPLRLYYQDFNNDGWVDIIDSYANREGRYVPRRRLFQYGSVPAIRSQMRSHGQFASATLEGIFGDRLNQIPYKEINTLQHMVFINSETGFEARPLPKEAQFSAGFHAGVADLDNDGHEDLFLSQNFFGVPRQIPRLDAGRGLWLKGDGRGYFQTVPGHRSGIKIYGEQRGAALSDFNHDGRVDLAVSQNGARTKLYMNRTESPGYRIRLRGPAGNTDGVGSLLRLLYADGSEGPARELQSGAGYWSQSSYTQVLGAEAEVRGIRVHWFDGTRQQVDVVPGKRSYLISHPRIRRGSN